VDAWQNGILSNPNYPGWLDTTIFNELYETTAANTFWVTGPANSSAKGEPSGQDRFSLEECYDYQYYGTSDRSLSLSPAKTWKPIV
jgi:uncharacterized protein (DUF608 family)